MNKLESSNKLPRRTTPTWEVELLISGGAVFAMLQLPGLLDQAFFWTEPRLAGDWRQLAILVYVYTKGAAVTLACTFVLHILLRARWIALVGMHSVYPEGIRWDKIKSSPIQREVELELDKPFPDLIERADNLATSVFAIGVMLGLVFGVVTVVASSIFALSVFLGFLSAGRLSAYTWMIALLSAIAVPFVVAVAMDHWRGKQWRLESLPRRAVKSMIRGYSRLGFGRSSNPISTLISSYSSDGKVGLLTVGVMTVALLSGVMSAAFAKNSDRLGNYSMFPWSDGTLVKVDSAHYDDKRNPLSDGTAPYIQSVVATGPYVKLMLPYQPRLDEPAMRKHCSGTNDLDNEQRSKARLDCLVTLHPVSLDGQELTNFSYDVSSDSRTDRPALLAMIDVRSLPAGRHELRIGRAPPATDEPIKKGSKDERDVQDYVIPFWR